MWQLVIVLSLCVIPGQACIPLQGIVTPANADGFVNSGMCLAGGQIIAAQLATNPAVQNVTYSCGLPPGAQNQ